MASLRLTRDANGVPRILCDDLEGCYRGLGQVHARLRPLQTLVLTAAARGELMASLWPTAPAERIDVTVARLRLRERAAAAVAQLAPRPRRLLWAYLRGVREGFVGRPPPAWLRFALRGLRPPEAEDVAAALLLTAYLSQGEGQARMERATVALVQHGAQAHAMRALLGPAADGLDADLLRRVPPLSLQLGGTPAAGGSNAWAVGAARSASGHALLAGDPHQPVGELPGMFLEVRARMASGDYLLGATVPGLPAFVVGRSRRLAWSGTFAFADNHDLTVEQREGDKIRRADGKWAPVRRRAATLGRRVGPSLQHHHDEVDDAVLLPEGRCAKVPPTSARRASPSSHVLAEHWAAHQGLGATLSAFLQLPLAYDVAEARTMLASTSTLNLQFVLADRKGYVCRQRAGATPRRRAGWSGLVPASGWEEDAWTGLETPEPAPVLGGPAPSERRRRKEQRGAGAQDAADAQAVVVAANDGALPWATLPQPDYRAQRIAHLLSARSQHDVRSFCAMQADIYSLQGMRLRPTLLAKLAPGPLHRALSAWDGRCDAASHGAHAFALARKAALEALAPTLGGDAWRTLLQHSELGTWWCKALDDALMAPSTWTGPAGSSLAVALANVAKQTPRPWGEVQRLTTRHQLFGRAGGAGTVPLVGSLATVCQGNILGGPDGVQAIAPAYRMVCDLGEDALHTCGFGGGDEKVHFSRQRTALRAWQEVAHHVLRPPTGEERPLEAT